MVTNPTSEPYTTVTLGSLSDGGPFQPIPNRGSTGGLALTPGNESNGRYWWDDVSALMLNSQQGPTSDVIFTDNWCSGGNYFVNGGGNPLVGGHNLGQFLRNKFVDDQGDYGSGLASENGHTLDFGGSYTAGVNVTAPTTGADKNYYIATNNGIVVRA